MAEFSMYSAGSASFLHEVFNGLAMITGSGDFVVCVQIGLLIGCLAVCIQSVLQGARSIAWQNILLGFVLYMCFFAVPSRVVVEDLYTGKTYAIDNVPLGAAAAGSVISKIGYGLTDLFETGYGEPYRLTQMPYLSSLKYILQTEGAMSSALALDKLDALTDLKVQPTLTEYAAKCIIPTLKNEKISDSGVRMLAINTLLEKGANDKANGTAIYKKDGSAETKSCAEAYKRIATDVLPKVTPAEFNSVFLSFSGLSDKDAYVQGCSLQDTLNALGAAGENTQHFMLTSLMTPIMARAYTQWRSKEDVLADAAIAQAVSQRNIQWTAEQEMWSSVAQPLMAFFEGLLYAITPFMAVLFCMGTFGLRLVGKYFQTILWVNLWMPLMSICNLYITMNCSSEITASLSGVHASIGSFYGLNSVNQILENQIAVGGMLAAATPMLALMIISGSSYAFTSLASRLNGADHINEKLLRPDIAASGPALQIAPAWQRDSASGNLRSGQGENIPTITMASATSQDVASALQRTRAAETRFQRSISENAQTLQAYQQNRSFNEALSRNFTDASTNSTSANTAVVNELLKSGSFTAGANAQGSLTLTASKGFDIAGLADKIGKVGGSAGLGLQGSLGASYLEQLRDSGSVTLSEADSSALTRSLAKTMTGSEGFSFGQTSSIAEAESFAKAAGEVNAAHRAYTQTASSRRSLAASYQVKSNVAAKRFEDLQGTEAGERASEALRSVLGGAHGKTIRDQAALFKSENAMGLTGDTQCLAAAAVSVLAQSGSAEDIALLNRFMNECGYLGSVSGNLTAQTNRRLPGSDGILRYRGDSVTGVASGEVVVGKNRPELNINDAYKPADIGKAHEEDVGRLKEKQSEQNALLQDKAGMIASTFKKTWE